MKAVQPVDMFPQTHHVENVVLLKKLQTDIMVSFHKHNPLLRSRLLAKIQSNNPAELLTTLSGLSVSESRTANYLLSEDLLMLLSAEQYWNFFSVIVPTNSKGYLGTFLKAAVKLYKQKQLVFDSGFLSDFASYATLIDVRKFLETMLPLLRVPTKYICR